MSPKLVQVRNPARWNPRNGDKNPRAVDGIDYLVLSVIQDSWKYIHVFFACNARMDTDFDNRIDSLKKQNLPNNGPKVCKGAIIGLFSSNLELVCTRVTSATFTVVVWNFPQPWTSNVFLVNRQTLQLFKSKRWYDTSPRVYCFNSKKFSKIPSW